MMVSRCRLFQVAIPGRSLLLLGAILAVPVLDATSAAAFWADGGGYYGLKGSTETAPAFSKETGTFQAIEQSFALKGEARFNDQSSMFLEMRLFENPRAAYLGDTAEPKNCPNRYSPGKSANSADPCSGQHQNGGDPGYRPYAPKFTEAYVRYAFDYCLLDAGRRPRSWGLGMYLDAGDKPFDTDQSLFDGVTCNINLQKSNTLGFSVGYDKLAESGRPNDASNSDTATQRSFGATDPSDDLDQIFFTIEYDDRKANAGSPFTKQIGVYFAQVSGKPAKTETYTSQDLQADGKTYLPSTHTKETGGDDTDLKFLDLYTGFYLGDLALKNELLFRMGKSRDLNWTAMGASNQYSGDLPPNNRLDSIALAGGLEWTVAHSGAPLGPSEFNKGDAKRHVLFFNYAYAPGDSDGYRSYDSVPDGADQTTGSNLLRKSRSSSVKAIAFNRNFKPALLLFNGHPGTDSLYVDGVFDPSRVMDATIFSTGYRYESLDSGNFEFKLITATLNSAPPSELTTYYNEKAAHAPKADTTPFDDGKRPVGFYSRNLGVELDLTYDYKVGREADVGVAGAVALPGKAWQTQVGSNPTTDFLIQSFAAWHF